MKVNPPNCFILPPEYIYTDEFHKAVYNGRGTPEIYDEKKWIPVVFNDISDVCISW